MKSLKDIIGPFTVSEAGTSAERQETGFVDAVNLAVKSNHDKPVTIKSGDASIVGVIKAEKFTGRQISGSEPYTDVRLFTSKGIINLSMKGPAAPTLAGGGLRGIENIIPGLAARFFQAALSNHLKNKLPPGAKVPDTFGKLNDKDKNLLVIGNKAIGGPIDFMYIGPMAVMSKYHIDGTMTVNGSLIPALKYAKEHDLYFRLRARRFDQTFMPDHSRAGIPTIYSRSPSKGDIGGRLVITDKVPATGGTKVIVF